MLVVFFTIGSDSVVALLLCFQHEGAVALKLEYSIHTKSGIVLKLRVCTAIRVHKLCRWICNSVSTENTFISISNPYVGSGHFNCPNM